MVFSSHPDEAELVEACLKNDRRAQKLMYEKYKDAMFTLAYRILVNFEDAADALQEGFIQVFKSLESFRNEASLGAWIKIIVVRASYRKLKHLFVFEELDKIESEDLVYFDETLSGEELDRAIMALSEGYRLVFTLVEVEGYKHQEVAEILGISVGTSKSQLYHAKQKLQKQLACWVD